jgi:gliding motility-associated-like protein
VSSFVITTPIAPNFTYTTDCFQNASFTNLTSPAGNYQYNWITNGSLATTIPNPTINFPVFGDQTITLIATDANNCSYDSTKTIFVEEGVKISDFVVPNVITPNQDGVNEFIELPILLEECLQYKIKIMNRWGNLVYEMNGAQNAFMGRDKHGKELQDGVYFYILESEDIDCESDQFKGACSGMITILRK